MPENCIQGALNEQSIVELKKQTTALFGLHEQNGHTLNSIKEVVVEIKTIQQSEKDHRIRLDKKFSDHIESGVGRIDEIKKNTAFRTTGVWIIGTVFAIIGWVTKTLTG